MLPREDFIRQELSRDYFDFPEIVDDVYSSVYNWISNQEGMRDFDVDGPPSNLNNVADNHESRVNTAREFSYLLPAHTLKIYRALLEVEEGAKSSSIPILLDRPEILLVDVGCGGGTASTGLISLLLNYQAYRRSHNLPVSAVNIRIAAIDPNDYALEIYNTFIRECQERIRHELLNLTITLIPERFNASMPRLLEWVNSSGKRISTCMIAFGNVIRPFIAENNDRKERRSRYTDFLTQWLPSGWGEKKSIEEEHLVSALFDSANIDTIVIPLIASKSGSSKRRSISYHASRKIQRLFLKLFRNFGFAIRKSRKHKGNQSKQDWFQELSDFQNAIYKALKSRHQARRKKISKRTLTILGPADCYFRKCQNRHEPETIDRYSWGYIIAHKLNFINDKDWERILSRENILLAWVRVRNALSFEMIEDTLEIRLFEAFIDENIDRLRNHILSYRWEALEIAEMLHYRMPKGADKDPRPLSLCRLEDQISATAILQVIGKKYPYSSKSSFAYRLNGAEKGESLYEDWFSGYSNFLNKARKATEDHPDYFVIQADLSSYYTDVLQDELFSKVEHLWHLNNSRATDLTDRLLRRDCGLDRSGCGIPQGHIISGMLANIYLTEIDNLFGPGNDWGIEYFRYVDDMIFLIPSSVSVEKILGLLDQQLGGKDPEMDTPIGLGLTRSAAKTSQMTTQEFLELIEKDPDLDQISKEFNFFLSDLYKLSAGYQNLLQNNWWDFVRLYQRLLTSIGVYISRPRLSRKLNKNMYWWNRLKFYFSTKIKLPEANSLDDLIDIDAWNSQFISYPANQIWLQKRRTIMEDLLKILVTSNDKLKDPEASRLDLIRARRRYRFAVNRLGKLGYEDVADHFIQGMIDEPWMFPVRRVAQDLALQGNEAALIAIHQGLAGRDSPEWAFVRASILKAFSELLNFSDNVIGLLQNEAAGGMTSIEMLMAAETLILINQNPGITRSDLVRLTQAADHSALMKNYAVLHALADGDEKLPIIDSKHSRTLNYALEYLRIDPELQLISMEEPDIIRKEFYERDYPDDESEFPEIPSWAH